MGFVHNAVLEPVLVQVLPVVCAAVAFVGINGNAFF